MIVLKIAVQEVHAILTCVEHIIDNIVHAAHSVSDAYRWAEVIQQYVIFADYKSADILAE